jgi:hypothetical protein
MAVSDLFVFGFIIFAVSLVVVIGGYIFSGMQANSVINQTFTMNGTTLNASNFFDRFYNMFDWFTVLLAIFFIIAMIILGYILPSHPIFTFLGLLLIIVWLIVAPQLSNAFITMMQTTPIGAVATKFPLTSLLMYYLPVIGLVAAVITNIVTYGKSGGGGV